MNKTVAAVVLGISMMFAADAPAAEVIEDGVHKIVCSYGGSTTIMPFEFKRVGEIDSGTYKGDGIYVLKLGDGYLFAAGSNDGDKVVTDGSKATKWWGHKGSKGWVFCHADNKANSLSFNYDGDGKLRLRRANAGGRGMDDQAWKLEPLK